MISWITASYLSIVLYCTVLSFTEATVRRHHRPVLALISGYWVIVGYCWLLLAIVGYQSIMVISHIRSHPPSSASRRLPRPTDKSHPHTFSLTLQNFTTLPLYHRNYKTLLLVGTLQLLSSTPLVPRFGGNLAGGYDASLYLSTITMYHPPALSTLTTLY